MIYNRTIYECHGHIILDSFGYAGSVERHKNGLDKGFIRRNLKICSEHGIKFYRDGGDRHGASVYAKTVAGEYGIDYRTPAYILHKKGHYGSMFGRAFENASEFRALVAEAVALGADFIKTSASWLLDFTHGVVADGPSLSLPELAEMVKVCHGEGLAVMVHANGADSIKCAVEAGADSVEHGFFMDIYALQIMAQTGAVWVPTCVTAGNLIGAGRYDDAILRGIFEGHKAMLTEALSIGVPVACGSDAGASCVPQGSGTLDESSVLDSLGIDAGPGNRKIEEVFRRRC